MRFAFFLVALSLSLISPVNAGSPYSIPKAETATEVLIPFRFGVNAALPSPAPAPSIDPLHLELEALQVAKDDLVQQRAMAEHGRSSVWIGVLNLAISLGALALLGWTMWETRRATQAARDAADAAHKSIDLQRSLGEAQVGAYISLSELKARWLKSIFKVTLDIQNSGQSPALFNWLVCNIKIHVDHESTRLGKHDIVEIVSLSDLPAGKKDSLQIDLNLPESFVDLFYRQDAEIYVEIQAGVYSETIFERSVSAYTSGSGLFDFGEFAHDTLSLPTYKGYYPFTYISVGDLHRQLLENESYRLAHNVWRAARPK